MLTKGKKKREKTAATKHSAGPRRTRRRICRRDWALCVECWICGLSRCGKWKAYPTISACGKNKQIKQAIGHQQVDEAPVNP